MTRLEHLQEGNKRLRALLQQVYIFGVAYASHAELCLWLHRERATKNFHSDIEGIWRSEMELIGYDAKKVPSLQYAWVPSSNGWAFVWNGAGKDALDWKTT